jgi:NAD(P)-dependent dehydrogenase (short-subunit alcohol dehydrogenase family)
MGSANGRKSIFITGAASGMGRETARLFHGKGWFVGAYDQNTDGLKTLEGELGADNCLIRRLDVTDKKDFEKAVAEFGAATGGKMDVLYNNAGIGAGGFFDEMPFEDSLKVVNVNFVGVLNGIHSGIGLLKATPGSLCFTTSSSSATYGMPGIAVYSATKHAVKGLTEALSIEFRRYGVRAADVLPGLIDTPILPEGVAANAPKEGMFRAIPPMEVAKVVWEAYGSDKLHWYVPPELSELDKAAGNMPELVREQIATTGPIAKAIQDAQAALEKAKG